MAAPLSQQWSFLLAFSTYLLLCRDEFQGQLATLEKEENIRSQLVFLLDSDNQITNDRCSLQHPFNVNQSESISSGVVTHLSIL